MKVYDYYKNVFVPANSAVSALRRAGMPISLDRVHQLDRKWEIQIRELEREVESAAQKRGIHLKYSEKHQVKREDLIKFLFSAQGLGLDVYKEKASGPSTEDGDLMPYASISHPWAEDIREVWCILKIRSMSKGQGVWLHGLPKHVRADGAIHPQFNWAAVRTARISASNPAVHQIPERSDKEVADGIKSCFVPRVKPCLNPQDWDPRIHGSCIRWDIDGAEAAIRAAMLTYLFCSKPCVLWDYIRNKKDPHGLTASMIYEVPEGTYKKGDPERDTDGKHIFFSEQFGGGAYSIQNTLWTKARKWVDIEEAELFHKRFFDGYPELLELYELDKWFLGKHGYVQDGYGRRRVLPLPPGASFKRFRNGKTEWETGDWKTPEGRKTFRLLEKCWHKAANTPTQGMNATDNLWMIALAYHGEYVDLKTPPMWDDKGKVYFPEAANWRLHEGPGPGGKPFQAWQINTVHDSAWLDCAPGYLEPTVKLCYRRCTGLPFDWRLKSDVPYRVSVVCGPDMANLESYNKVAKRFGMETLPDR